MKLIRAEVRSFGKLKDFILEPQAGLNRYIHPNEYGKTTLIQFLYFMLYGYDAKRLKGYFPWSGDPMAGVLLFEHQGKQWRIERIHPQKGTEKRKIFCPETGEDLPLPAREQPGPYFLKMDGETFLRTFCITQGDLLFTRTDGLDVALKNMAATGDENVSFAQAEAYLHKQHTRYMYRGKTQGPLLDLKTQLETDRRQLQELQSQVNDQLLVKEEWEQLEQERVQKNEEIAALKERLQKATASDALKRLQQLRQFKEQAETPLPQPPVAQETLKEMEQVFEAAEQAEKGRHAAAEETDRLQAQWELLGNSLEHFGFHSLSASQIEKLKKGGNGFKIAALSLSIAGIVSIITGVILHRFGYFIGAIALAIAAGLLIGEQVRKRRICLMNGAMNTAQLMEKWEQYTQVKEQRDAFGEQKNQAALREEQASQLANAAKERLEQLKFRYRLLSLEEVHQMQIQWGVYEQSLTRRKDALQEQLILGGKSKEELIRLADGATLTEETADQVQTLLSDAEEQLRRLQQKKDALRIQDLAALWEEQTHLKRQVSEKKKQAALWEKELAAVQQTLRWLRSANEEMNTHFAPRLCTLAGEHLCRLTDGKYETLILNERYEIQVQTKDGTYPLSSFSAGTKDAVYFAFRLAVGSLLSDTALPMVLDDPFVNLDPARKAAAETLLQKAAEDRQILYFSCHE